MDCDLCRRFFLDAEGKVIQQNGQPIPRSVPPACQYCKKRSVEFEALSPKNELFYMAYRSAMALGPTEAESEDALFRYLCGLVHRLEELCNRVVYAREAMRSLSVGS